MTTATAGRTSSIRQPTDEEWYDLRVALLLAVREMPYLTAVLYNLHPLAAPGLGTMGVDARWRLYVDFEFAKANWTRQEFAAVLLHEANHVLRKHSGRADIHGVTAAPDRFRWNIAGDIGINDDLSECFEASAASTQLALPEGGVRSSTFGFDTGLTTEAYYELLGSKMPNPTCDGSCADDSEPGGGDGGAPGDGSPGESDGDGGEGSGGSAGEDDADGNGEAGGSGGGDGQGSDSASGASGAGGSSDPSSGNCDGTCSASKAVCGSGSGGNRLPVESGDQSIDGIDGIGEQEADLVRRAAAIKIREAAASEGSKSRGTVPAGLRRWAEETLAPPQVDWRKQLNGAVRRALNWAMGKVDYTYRRPSRRTPPGGILRPSMQQPKPQVVTVLDTSGSMSEDDIAAALAEVEGICTKAGVRGRDHRLMCVDAASYGLQPVKSAKDVTISGGGGTDMRIGIDAAVDLNPRPDVIVVMTDGYTPWPEVAPVGCKVVVVIIRPGHTATMGREGLDVPEWAEVAIVDSDPR